MIRPAVAAELPALAELERDLFGLEAWDEGALGAELGGPGRWVAVDEDAGRITAYAVVMVAGVLADLLRIAVRPDRRRVGVASGLLDAARRAARGAGAERMLLEVSADNTAALAFYAARGFAEIDRRPRYYRDGSDAVVLELGLGAD